MKVRTAVIATVALSVALVGCSKETKKEVKPSTSTSTSSSAASSSSTTTSATPGGQVNKTILDYTTENNINQIPVHHGDPGSPTIDLPVPPGWHALAESSGAPYGAIVYDAATDANDPPTIAAIVVKLEGNADPAKILEYAPGELKNLPGFEGGSANGVESTLGGFKAWQFGGSYVKSGKKRTVAQKTVVITGPNGLYLLQLNADGPDADTGPLMDATNVIDDQTTITP